MSDRQTRSEKIAKCDKCGEVIGWYGPTEGYCKSCDRTVVWDE